MSLLYDRLVATVVRQMERFGGAVTLYPVVQGSYDPATGAATTTQTGEAATGFTAEYSSREIDGTKIRAGDRKLILGPKRPDGALITRPAPGAVARIGAVDWQAVAVDAMEPAGTVLFYTVQIRR